jgi:LPS sulfotransferase NodH
MTTVRFEDIRALGYCSRGARAWFAQHGLDYLDFVRQGLPAERLAALGDALADAAVAQAVKREVLNGQSQ